MTEQAAPQNLEEKLSAPTESTGPARCTWEQLARKPGLMVERADGTIEHHGLMTATHWRVVSGRGTKRELEQIKDSGHR